MLLVTFTILCLATTLAAAEPFFISDTFPNDFVWSAATASYQVEGGWNVDGKGANIWDTFTHNTPYKISDRSNGDIACDSYNKYKEDVQLLKDMGLKYYRFSLSWSRILPNGDKSKVNQAGIQYYNNLINELLKYDIKPQVTLYHWDLPQALQSRGGWLSSSIITWFNDYAELCYKTFGDRVKFWITFNEPWVVCLFGYGYGKHAPGKNDRPGFDTYTCSKNLLLAHAKAWRTYNTMYRFSQKGQAGIVLNNRFSQPNNSQSKSDVDAANRAQQFDLGWFAHPILSRSGDYPQVMKDRVAERSRQQGYRTSRLPVLTVQQINDIKGTYDFVGLNFYTGRNIVDNPRKNNAWDPKILPNFDDDKGIIEAANSPGWRRSGSSWLFVAPELIRKCLVWIKAEYDNPILYITENGVSDKTGQLNDTERIYYFKHYINHVLQAIKLDGCNVKGYTAWSLLDNFEWASGYTEKFGLHYVNFSDPNRRRMPKQSAEFYKTVVKNNGFPKSKRNGGNRTQIGVLTALFYICCLLLSIY